MIFYLIRKILYGGLVLFGVILLVFVLFTALPDPARMTMGQRSDVMSMEAVNKEFGLDKSIFVQYLMLMNDISPISFHNATEENKIKYSYIKLIPLGEKAVVLKTPYLRRSYQSKKNVTEILLDSLKGTLVLAISAMLIATFLGIALGAVSALYKNSWIDQLNLFISTLGISLPSFFAAIIIAWLFGYVYSEYTGLNMTGSLIELDPFEGKVIKWRNLILPAIALGIRPLAIIVQLTRSSMLDVLSQDYIRTAKAKGISQTKIIIDHALRNALNPVITAISGWFASLMSGAFFIEYIFNWKGIGKVTVEALEKSDFPVVMGAVLIIAFIFVLINILVDLLYALLDPRVRLG